MDLIIYICILNLHTLLMRTTQSLIGFLILISTSLFSQSITGVIVGEDNKSVEFATISAINPKDSTLISYTNSDSKGEFELTELNEGNLLFQVNYVGLRTFSKLIDFKDKEINMGKITLEIANELDEVVVNADLPIILKEDTISYSTKAFKIRVDDNVEDLLKKLPGVEISADGQITAQGESVSKVYVDGREFFSGDPTIATKNLSADAIKSIEVIDEKSDKSRVSGIDDAETSKVINLKLKDDSKVNDFGKFQAGYGTDDRYAARANYNRFTPKTQVSIIGQYNNINSSGSDITEVTNSSGNSSGFVTTGIGGVNASYELKKRKSIGVDYFYNNRDYTSGDVFTTRTEFIDDLEIKSEIRSRNENINISNKANFNFIDRSNKFSSFTMYGSYLNSNNNSTSITSLDKFNGNGELDLESIGKTLSDSKSNTLGVTADYSTRFNEESRRSIHVRSKLSYADVNSLSNNNQLNNFNVSDPDNSFSSKQIKLREDESQDYTIFLSTEYTEPINENHFIEVEAKVDFDSKGESVDQTNEENDVPQASLIYDQFYENADITASLKYKYSKNKFTLTTGAELVNQNQFFGIENDVNYNKNYTSVNPEFKIRYRPKKGIFMHFYLGKSLGLPGINQLTPVVNDYDPLYIRQGNPYLTPSENYEANVNYGKFFFDKGLSFHTSLRYTYSSNNIINTEFTDSFGVRTSSYDNLGDKNSVSLRFMLGNTVKSLNFRYRVSVSGGYNDYLSLINLIENETRSKDASLGISFENDKKEMLDGMIGASWNKNYTTFTSGNNSDRDYLKQSYYVKMDWNITDRLNLGSQFNYDIYTDSNFDSDQTSPIWNGSISYKLLKSKQLNLTFSAIDILNKSIGVERNSSDNYFEEIHKDVLGNYYMFSLTYKLGNAPPPKRGRKGPPHRRR